MVIEMDLKSLLTTKQAARMLGYSHKTLEAWRMKGAGPPYIRLPNTHIRYSHDDLISWVSGDERSKPDAYA